MSSLTRGSEHSEDWELVEDELVEHELIEHEPFIYTEEDSSHTSTSLTEATTAPELTWGAELFQRACVVAWGEFVKGGESHERYLKEHAHLSPRQLVQ